MIFISVDLPAPLSPTSATTSPGSTRKSTLSSAWTWRKALEIPRASSSGGVPFAPSAASSLPLSTADLLFQASQWLDPRGRRSIGLTGHGAARYGRGKPPSTAQTPGATDVTRGSACHGGGSADDAEAKSGSPSHAFHADRLEVDAVESGVLEQAQTIAQEERHD